MKRVAMGIALAVVAYGCSSSDANVNVDAGDAGPSPGDSGAPDGYVADRYVPMPEGGAVCGPLDTSSFVPGPYAPPSGKHQNKCSTQQMTDYVACITNADTSKCPQFTGTGSSVGCSSCIESLSTDKTWGPLVSKDGGKTLSFNTPGCLDLVLGAGTCGKDLDTSYDCQEAACGACDEKSMPTFNHCVDLALKTGCKSYDDQVNVSCAVALGDAQPPEEAACYPDDTIKDPGQRQADFLMRIGLYFCGQ